MKEHPNAIVTGSGRGIGKAVALELAKQGYGLCLNASSERSMEAAHELAREIEKTWDVPVISVLADVSDPAQAQNLVTTAIEELGPIELLVNNAGITRDGLLARMTEEDFDRVISVNLKGTFNCCKAVAKPMMKLRRGSIINMSSVVGISGNAGQVNYAAAKAGIIGLTKSLAKELAPRSITVNAVAPGFIQTSMTDALSDSQKEGVAERIALKRFGVAEEVAYLVAFLASDKARYITGQVITIDGGLSL